MGQLTKVTTGYFLSWLRYKAQQVAEKIVEKIIVRQMAERRAVLDAAARVVEIDARIENELLRSREPAEPVRGDDERHRIYFRCYLEAEKTGDSSKMTFLAGLLRDTPYADRLTPRGKLTLTTDPAGAKVTARRLIADETGRLTPSEPGIDLGKTPVGARTRRSKNQRRPL